MSHEPPNPFDNSACDHRAGRVARRCVLCDQQVDKRATGRTTRMLKQAIADASQQLPVVIVGASIGDCARLVEAVRRLLRTNPHMQLVTVSHGTGLPVPGQITVLPAGARDFDWRTGRCAGAGRETRFYIDHYTAEMERDRLWAEAERINIIARRFDV